jgi:YYY domain-containing protein
LALALFAFCIWLPLVTLRFLPYSQLFIVGVGVLLMAGSVAGFWQMRGVIGKVVRRNTSYIVITEAIFLGMVLLLGVLRSFRPDIRGWEMFMDEGFIAAIMRSPHLPPNDMWFSGYSINYYYYAHFILASLAKLLGQSPSIAFNTGISMFFGLTASNLFGVASNVAAWAKHSQVRAATLPDEPLEPASSVYPPLLGAVPYGLVAVAMGIVLGNLAATQQWWVNHGEPAHYDWFSPSRVIPSTINEFPAFSFLLSCFHAHVLALAFTILAIGLAFNLLLETDGTGLFAFGRGWQIPFTLGMTALVIGGLFTMNGWDLPTYLGLALVCIAVQQWQTYGRRIQFSLLVDLASAGISLIALSFLLFLPFYVNYTAPSSGVGLVAARSRTPLGDELLIYGLFIFIFLSLLILFAWRRPLFTMGDGLDEQRWRGGMRRLLIGLGCLVVLDILLLVFIPNSLTLMIMANLALFGVILLLYHVQDQGLAFVFLLGALAFALIAGCEIIYLRDAFEKDYPRMNTVFKFYFQAWALLALASGCGLFFLLERFWAVDKALDRVNRWGQRALEGAWAVILVGLCLASMAYPLLAPTARIQRYDLRTQMLALIPGSSLDGLTYLQNCHPPDSYPQMDSDPFPFCQYNVAADYEGIRWINANIAGDPVIVETYKDDYSLYGRVSTFTGLPTIMGWTGHELQWRLGWLNDPTNADAFNRRLSDIDAIYTDPDAQGVLSLMQQYNAQYLYVGPMEYTKYKQLDPKLDLHRFAAFMQTVYDKDGVTIYKMRQS